MSGGAWMPPIRVRPAPTTTSFSTRLPTCAPPMILLPLPNSMPAMSSGFLQNSSADVRGAVPVSAVAGTLAGPNDLIKRGRHGPAQLRRRFPEPLTADCSIELFLGRPFGDVYEPEARIIQRLMQRGVAGASSTASASTRSD